MHRPGQRFDPVRRIFLDPPTMYSDFLKEVGDQTPLMDRAYTVVAGLGEFNADTVRTILTDGIPVGKTVDGVRRPVIDDKEQPSALRIITPFGYDRSSIIQIGASRESKDYLTAILNPDYFIKHIRDFYVTGRFTNQFNLSAMFRLMAPDSMGVYDSIHHVVTKRQTPRDELTCFNKLSVTDADGVSSLGGWVVGRVENARVILELQKEMGVRHPVFEYSGKAYNV